MFAIDVSLYSIRRLLKRKKLTRKVRRKKKNKHTKKVKIHHPGQHTQIDVRHLNPMKDEKKRYVYDFVDHACLLRANKIYRLARHLIAGEPHLPTWGFINRIVDLHKLKQTGSGRSKQKRFYRLRKSRHRAGSDKIPGAIY
jgi:hypothetical protein